MQSIAKLTKKAINAAKNKNWQQAADCNLQILDLHPKNIDALNRLAVSYMQAGDKTKAQKTLKQVLKLDKYNKIAQKNLEKTQKNKKSEINFSEEGFIEEPGRAKNIELIRLTDSQEMDQVHVGQACILDTKSTYVSVLTKENEQYIGTLPQDVSQKLIELIETGNEYGCWIQSCGPEHCQVHLKECKVSQQNKNKNSFSFNKDMTPETASIDEFGAMENIPLDIVDTDTDVEDEEINVSKIKTE